MNFRKQRAREVRYNAADLAYERPHPRNVSSGDEFRLRKQNTNPSHKYDGTNVPSLINSFTKGFTHDANGFIVTNEDFEAFIRASDTGDIDQIAALPLNTNTAWISKKAQDAMATVRGWESMGSGQTFELEGPDAQAMAIPPAPRIGSDELCAEMAELYWMALCRDVKFTDFTSDATVAAAADHMNGLAWIKNRSIRDLKDYEKNRKRGYFKNPDHSKAFKTSNIFRGNISGDDIGFYISQFLYVGNKSQGISGLGFDEDQGIIQYGSITADQRVRIAIPGLDYMTTWEQWLDVQNAADLRGKETYENADNSANINRETGYRFIVTPRDLATYVHYDQLHEAYFNACVIMLNNKVPFDEGIPFRDTDSIDKQIGFATFGGPHILTLVSEVASRALKAVRYQKYNVHRRARPEQVAGFLHQYASGNTTKGMEVMKKLYTCLTEDATAQLPDRIKLHNQTQNANVDRHIDPSATTDCWLLPMPFVEGSPMHPSYGSGHATVAGACVTILKAFFDSGYQLPFNYRPTANGRSLEINTHFHGTYTVETELNKLAANIAFGRDWAGVHWYSDQLESLRLGEQLALGILEEQKLTYGENFSMSIPLFDGTTIRI